ncbi:hypothetical protein [Algibacter lectus]|uniref:Permease of the drug/metabolite transporter (DMT) superfamily n=1 Tax=Algibacter lectus TaxID=221126 RepID=A0A090VC63_9FLAO|nr:permease of the drug/metabolite transporter (DMT) superfamily [Algibacter lectus]
MVLKGFDKEVSGYGLLLIFISAIFSGFVYIILSKIGKSEHPVVVVNYFMIISTLVGLFGSINNWVMPIGKEWLLLGILGVFGYFGQVYMTKLFKWLLQAK